MLLRIDLRQIKYFVVVAEERSFRAAADRLHMSQPPLSRQIKQLETDLGATLLVRASSGVTLTKAGREFLEDARRTLRQAEKAIKAGRSQPVSDQRPLRVGYTTVFDPEVFPHLEPHYRRLVPNGSIDFSGNTTVELIKRLRRGSLDVALIGLPSDTRGLAVEALHREPLVAVLPSSHALAKRKVLSLKDLEPHPFFWPQRRANPGYFDHYQQVFDRVGFAPKRMLAEPADHHVLLADVARGHGIGLVPRSMQKLRRAGAVFRPLKEKDLWIGFGVAHRGTTPTHELTAFLRAARGRLKG